MEMKKNPTGYSKTHLARKLGIKEEFKIHLIGYPSHYFDLFADYPDDVQIVKNPTPESLDFIHLFCTSLKELMRLSAKFKPLLKKSGMLWISWPKGKSSIATDLKRDMIREYLLENGLVDVKVAAIDEDWSGLKFVYRLTDR